MSDLAGWVAVGVVLRPHGLRGAVLVKPLTRTTEEFLEAPLDRVHLRRAGTDMGAFRIAGRSLHKGLPMVTFAGVANRTASEQLKGAEIVIPEEERWDPGEGSFYFDELEGLALVEEGREIGRVLRVEEGTAHDFLVFRHPRHPRREVLLPFRPEFVLSVARDEGRIDIRLPEGLLDL